MKNINNYISEKLHINKNYKADRPIDDLDSFDKYLSNNGLWIVKGNSPGEWNKIYKKYDNYPWISFKGYDIYFVLNDSYFMDKFEFKFHTNQYTYEFIGLEKYDTAETDDGHVVLRYTQDNADKLIKLFKNARC